MFFITKNPFGFQYILIHDLRNVLFTRKTTIVYYLIKVVHAVKFVLDNMKKKTGKFDEETFREVLKWYKPIYPNVPNLRGK